MSTQRWITVVIIPTLGTSRLTLRGFSIIGWAGIIHPAGWPEPELGWVLRRQSWGVGFATEAAARAMEYAFTEIGLPRVSSFIDPRNVRSIAVAERLGEKHTGSVVVAGSERSAYVITREDWENSRL